MRITSLLAALVFFASPAPASDASSLAQHVSLTRAELLMLQTGVINEQLNTLFSQSSEPTPFEEVSITLTDAQGKMHIDIMLELPYARQLQGQTPSQQMVAVEEMRKMLGGMMLILAHMSDPELQKVGIYGNIEPHPASSPVVDAWLRSLTMEDMVLNLGFRHNGQPQLYATASQSGVDFEASAPNLR